MKHISYKFLIALLFLSGNQLLGSTSKTDAKTALDYLLECPECKEVSELRDNETTRGCCSSCNNCSSCNTCSNCCKKGESATKRGSCCKKCSNCTSCNTCSSCNKRMNTEEGEEELELEMLITKKKLNNFSPEIEVRSIRQ